MSLITAGPQSSLLAATAETFVSKQLQLVEEHPPSPLTCTRLRQHTCWRLPGDRLEFSNLEQCLASAVVEGILGATSLLLSTFDQSSATSLTLMLSYSPCLNFFSPSNGTPHQFLYSTRCHSHRKLLWHEPPTMPLCRVSARF